MSDERAPGVYVEEVSYRSRSIPGVPVLAWVVAAALLGVALARFVSVRVQQGRVQLDSDSDEYAHLRRLLLLVSESIDRALRSAGFEPDDGC